MFASARRSMTSIDPYNIVKAPQRLLLKRLLHKEKIQVQQPLYG